jgi:hypothetical protein
MGWPFFRPERYAVFLRSGSMRRSPPSRRSWRAHVGCSGAISCCGALRLGRDVKRVEARPAVLLLFEREVFFCLIAVLHKPEYCAPKAGVIGNSDAP